VQVWFVNVKFGKAAIHTNQKPGKYPHGRNVETAHAGEMDVDFGWKCLLVRGLTHFACHGWTSFAKLYPIRTLIYIKK
jgi:hypothetical protein